MLTFFDTLLQDFSIDEHSPNACLLSPTQNKRFTVPIGYGEPETVEKLRFSDNLCFDFAKHGRPKVPMRKLSPSESMKTEVHAPGFHARYRAAAAAALKRTLLTNPKHRT